MHAGPPPDLSQPCCALEGLTQLLSFVPGNFAVVLHSEPDCANLVLRDARAVDPRRFFCSNLGEAEAIAGRGRARLVAAVRHAIARRRPEAVFVLGGCVAGLIGDDTAEIVASLRLPSRVRVVAIDGGAFAMHGQAAIVDRFTGILLDAAPLRARKTPRAVGLVGFPPDDGEAKRLLARAGLALRAWPQLDSAQAEWNALAGVSLAVVSDARLFGRLGRILGERHRVPVVELVPPLGAAATERWLGGIAAGFGLERRMAAACSAERSVARRAVAAFRRRHGGKRLAVHVGGRKDFALPTLVRGGLSAVPAFAELGLRVELLFQGAVEEAQQRRIETLLAHHGLDVPYRCLPDRLSLTRALRAGRFAAVYCSDSLHEEVGAAGVPLVPVGSLRPGFAGCVANGAWLGARLR